MFGSTNPFGSQSMTSNISPFGGQVTAAPSAFGQQPAASTGPFGAPTTTAPAMGFGGFGSSNVTGPTAAPTGFGGFGSTGINNAQPNSAFGFGGTATGQQSTAPGPFGVSSTNAPNPFGTTQMPTTNTGTLVGGGGGGGGGLFGAQSSSMPTGGSLFGGTAFGSNAMTAPAPTSFGGFGATATSTTTTPAFGSTPASSSIFGSTPARPGLFGSTSTTTTTTTPTAFGSTTNTSSSPFGSALQSATTTMGFGSTTPAFFGSQSNAQQQNGTASMTFQTTAKQDGNSTIMMHHISAMPFFENKSSEELRAEDYTAGNRGTQGQQPPQGSSTSTFGGFNATTPSTNLFGAPSTGFGAMPNTGGIFGATSTTNPFAPTNPSSVGFGAKPLGTGFGTTSSSTTTTTGAFDTTATAGGFGGFGSKTMPTGGLFGAAGTTNTSNTGSIFGSSASAPNTNLFGAPATTTQTTTTQGLFGSNTTAPSSFASTGTFGSTTTAPPSTSIFGSTTLQATTPTSNTQGLFGASTSSTLPNTPSTGGLFGATSAPSIGGGLFGSTTPAAPSGGGGFFGSSTTSSAPTAGGSLFTSPSPAMGSGLFGATSKPATGSFLGGNLFNTPSTGFTGSAGAFGTTLPVSTPTNAAASQSPGGGLFGSSQSGGFFGSTPAPVSTPTFTTSSTPVPASADMLLAQQMAVLEAQRKELALLDAWRGTSSTESRVVAYSLPERISPVRPTMQLSNLSRPFSSPPLYRPNIKVLPRGFISEKSESSDSTMDSLTASKSTAATPSSSLGSSVENRTASKAPILSPNAYVGLSNKNLVIKSKLTPRPTMKLTLVDESSQGNGDSLADRNHRHHEDSTILSPSLGTLDKPSQTPIDNVSSRKTEQQMDTSYDYYQKVIASPIPGDSSISPSAAFKSKLPKLTKSEYTVYPSLSVLSSMSEVELATVMDFTVSRSGYGSVAWEGAVDVRDVDLDSVVEIDSQTVAVYSSEESKGTKPPVGSKLNRPAIITILNVYPKESTELSAELKVKFARKIAKLTKKADAELISYDVETGTWKFRVFHFSRYGLLDDDDDSDEDDNINAEFNHGRENEEKTISRFGIHSFVDDDMSDDGRKSPVLYSEEASLKEVNEDILIRAADDAYKRFSLEENFQQGETVHVENIVRHFVDEGPDDMNFSLRTRIFQGDLKCIQNSSSICTKIAMRTGLVQASSSRIDFGLRMGKSFRVGWRPDGSFVYPKHMNLPNILSTSRPCFSSEDKDGLAKALTAKMLSSHFKYSVRLTTNDSSPCFMFPEASDERFKAVLRDLRDTYSTVNDPSHRVVALALSLLLMVTQWKDIDEKRKIHALSTWFSQASQDVVSKDMSVLQSVYSAVCRNNVSEACSIAYENKYLHLSALIANNSLQASLDMKDQYNLWSTSGCLPYISPSLASLYALRSGEVMKYDEKSTLDSCAWRRHMGMLLFRLDDMHENGSEIFALKRLVSMYKKAIEKGTVPYPVVWYEKPRSGKLVDTCLLYNIFLICSDEKVKLIDMIHPKGHTNHHHDLLNTFFLASAFSASPDLPSVTSEEGLMISDSLAAQLVSAGLWEWAVYVYLFKFGPETDSMLARKEKARDIVLRYYDGTSTYKRFFLHHDLGVPDLWIEESLAHRCQYNFDSMGFIKHSSHVSKEAGAASTEKIFVRGEENCKGMYESMRSVRKPFGHVPTFEGMVSANWIRGKCMV